MKKYLNNKEMNDMIFLFYTLQTAHEMVEGWTSRDNMTSDEAKWLRTGMTFYKKAMQSVVQRLGDKERVMFTKRTV